MLDHMKQILVQLDERMFTELERNVPGSSRKRSEFIRDAIENALLRIQEEKTYQAYLKHPQEPGFPFDPDDWAPESEAIHSFSRPAKVPRKATRKATPKATGKAATRTASRSRPKGRKAS